MSDMYDGFISYSHAADDLLAPRLQSALQRFAKPWWKRRALRVFRDESSLSANPHLWESITEALDTSGWFVLLLSPDAAASEWVNQEIGYWVEHKDPSRILPVVTAGEFGWADGDVSGDAVPNALRGVFASEPRWVDLRFAKGEEQLDLSDPRFADAIADVASAMRGVAKDELAGEEVRQHRRTVRTAWAAGALLVALLVTSAFAGFVASQNAEEAERQAGIAEANALAEAAAREEADANAAAAQTSAAEAEENARQAQENAEEAARQAAQAREAEAIARARELSAASAGVLGTDPELAVLIGLEAIHIAPDSDAPPPAAQIALRQAIQTSFLLAKYPIPLVDGELFHGDLSPADDAVVLAEDTVVHLLELPGGNVRWTSSVGGVVTPEGNTGVTCVAEVWFSRDGSRIFVGLIDGQAYQCGEEPPENHVPRSGIGVVDPATGDWLGVHWLSECGDQIIGRESPGGEVIPISTAVGGTCDLSTFFDWEIQLLDATTFEVLSSIPAPDVGMFTWSADGTRLSIGAFHGWGAAVFDVATGEVVSETADGFLGYLSPDGSQILTTDWTDSVLISDADTGQGIDRLNDLGDSAFDMGWSDDGALIWATGRGPATALWDAATGALEAFVPNTGPGSFAYLTGDSSQLIHIGKDTVSVWDVSGSVEGARNTADVGGLIQANSVSGVSGEASMGAFLFRSDDWYMGTFDTELGVLGEATRPTVLGRRTAVLDDGRILNVEPMGDRWTDDEVIGPLVAWDPVSGETEDILGCAARRGDLEQDPETLGLSGPCLGGETAFFDVDRALISADRSTLAVTSRFGELLFLDPLSLEVIASMDLPDGQYTIREVASGWVATLNRPTGVSGGGRAISIYSLPDLDHLVTIPGDWAKGSPVGDRVAVASGPGLATILDAATGAKVRDLEAGTARIRGLAWSPDGSMLMTSATDGFMRIWDVESGIEIERIPMGDGIAGSGDGYWIDADTIGTTLGDGRWTTIDIGLESLLSLARARILRPFTVAECREYGIDPCPETLASVQSRYAKDES